MRSTQKRAIFQETPFDSPGETLWNRTFANLEAPQAGLKGKLRLPFVQEGVAEMRMTIDEIWMTLNERF